MDTEIDERLINARARLRWAVEQSLVPDSLMQTAQQCLIDLDCALSGGLSDSRTRMLFAQVDALISTVGDARTAKGRDAGPR